MNAIRIEKHKLLQERQEILQQMSHIQVFNRQSNKSNQNDSI